MADRLLFGVAYGLAVFLVLVPTLGPSPVHAADPDFCRSYARTALVQVRDALANPRYGAGLQGTRWSAEFSIHYEWCLGVSVAAAGAERDACAQLLRACAIDDCAGSGLSPHTRKHAGQRPSATGRVRIGPMRPSNRCEVPAEHRPDRGGGDAI